MRGRAVMEVLLLLLLVAICGTLYTHTAYRPHSRLPRLPRPMALSLAFIIRLVGWPLLFVPFLGFLFLLTYASEIPLMDIISRISLQDAGLILTIVGFAGGFVGFAGGFVTFLTHTADRLEATLRPPLEYDQRPPVVYLRPFAQDGAGTPMYQMNPANLLIGNREQQWVRALEPVGPVISVSNPYQALQFPGAARIPVAGAEWCDRVRELMSNAALVVISAGSSPGVVWEMASAVEMLPPRRLALLVPQLNAPMDWVRYKQALDPVLPKALPEDYPGTGYFHFDADWVPSFVKVELTVSQEPLAPLFQGLGVELKRTAATPGPLNRLTFLTVLQVCVTLGAMVATGGLDQTVIAWSLASATGGLLGTIGLRLGSVPAILHGWGIAPVMLLIVLVHNTEWERLTGKFHRAPDVVESASMVAGAASLVLLFATVHGLRKVRIRLANPSGPRRSGQ
jgi:hypothetical protein